MNSQATSQHDRSTTAGSATPVPVAKSEPASGDKSGSAPGTSPDLSITDSASTSPVAHSSAPAPKRGPRRRIRQARDGEQARRPMTTTNARAHSSLTTKAAPEIEDIERSDLAAGIVALSSPAEGIPAVIADERRLQEAAQRFASASGPVAVDAERASGFSYGQEAYLVQLRREGAGTILIDPIACPDLSVLNQAIAGSEWIFHAASQDLACLAEVGLVPQRIFDTEQAARLLHLPRVGLGAVLAQLLQVRLAKEHSAVNWSKRPLHRDWLNYATLDVELLIPLRDRLYELLVDAGKLDWALQEFEAIRTAPAPEPRIEPWRRTTGLNTIRTRQGMSVVRELWQARDHIARNRNIAPGRVLNDSAIILATNAKPRRLPELAGLGAFASNNQKKYLPQWLTAIQRGLDCPEDDQPTIAPPRNALGKSWRSRDPEVLERVTVLRERIAQLAETLDMPTENVLTPEFLRRLATDHTSVFTTDAATTLLTSFGARPWQVEHVAPIVSKALADYRDGYRVERDAQLERNSKG